MSAHEVNDASPPWAPLLKEGDILGGRYAIEQCLGVGGMASIFRAVHVGLDQPVAVKVISPTILELPGIVSRFMREARAATKLKSEHVVRVFDYGTTDDGAPYMVMELLEGRDLGAVIDDGFRPSVEDAIDYVLQACEALAEVHGMGIVHRDLKPPNLFVTRGTDGLVCLKLIDFGISRVDSPLNANDSIGLSSADVVMGSPGYMPPEQMESASAADARSDIWSLGAIAYELLIGHAPFDGDSLYDIYTAVIHSPPPLPSSLRPEIPPALDEILLKCLRVDPAERYEDVAQLALALAELGNEKAHARAASVVRVFAASGERRQSDGAILIATPSSSFRPRRLPTGPAFGKAKTRKRRLTAVSGALVGVLSLAGIGIVARPMAPTAQDMIKRLAFAPVHVSQVSVAARAEAPATESEVTTARATDARADAAPTSPVEALSLPTAWRAHVAPPPTPGARRLFGAEARSDASSLRRGAPTDPGLDFSDSASTREATDDRMLFEERK